MKWAYRWLLALGLIVIPMAAMAEDESGSIERIPYDVLQYQVGWWRPQLVTDFVFLTFIYQGDTLASNILPSEVWPTIMGFSLPDTAMVDQKITIRRWRQRRDGTTMGDMQIIHDPNISVLIKRDEKYRRHYQRRQLKDPGRTADQIKSNIRDD